jgi:hypothetical protein
MSIVQWALDSIDGKYLQPGELPCPEHVAEAIIIESIALHLGWARQEDQDYAEFWYEPNGRFYGYRAPVVIEDLI